MSEIMAPKPTILLGCALLSLGCADDVAPASSLVSSYQPFERRPVDVLLVIDDSPSMHGHQATLAANLGAFAHVFAAEDLLLDVRVAVVTTSVAGPTCAGAFARGGELLTDACAMLPSSAFVGPGEHESEILDSSDLRDATCSLASLERRISPIDELETDLALRPWFEAPTNSYGGNLAEGLTLPAALTNVGLRGFGGCEFESPLAAADLALARVRTAGDPAFGFLRTGAPLLIVFIGDEDDCSHPASSATVFDPMGERVFWSNPDADTPTSAVCHNASTACDEQSCEIVDRDLGGELTTDPLAAVLDPVAGFAAELDGLRAEREVAILVIGGVGANGQLAWPAGAPDDPEDLDWRARFGWSPGCVGANGVSGQPPGRLHALASAQDAEPLAASICANDWTGVLVPVGTGPSIVQPWCAPPEVGPALECELSVRTPIETLPLPRCAWDGESWVIPLGEDRCSTEAIHDDLSIECVDRGSAVEWSVVVRHGALPLPRGSVYESWCATEP